MPTFKCKMCGGDLELIPGQSVAECEYCGSRQTVPAADNEKKMALFARANRLRAACEFDKAAGIYETVVADFPEEAEAYWGLVLCKYGIEYVDDPATGKKIPTCHRSSFDSVLEDSNLEQALENADVIAQKVYREEAKQFERIRKGILEVSSTEKPYDIFICYKETDEKGDRTLDSLLAQDLYTALTDKGYRVFFSRVTLRGKLGEAFEPYIFAALNSAKVMLAVGTCYEYYNAVWVRNEWSRYLKICETDKSRHLIPCYKNLDPEDMPREFSHLQGADLGKMGAIQDVLFNMEKYIPLNKQTIIQEKVVVGDAGNNKIASLLDRGNMALEDGDWAKADSFFEDVLNNDSKNAQAYLGKVLAQEHCRTLDAFIRKRKDASLSVQGETLRLEPAEDHIAEIVEKYHIPGYCEVYNLRKLYDFDLSYHSDVAERKTQYHDEERYWASHKLLSRAEQFATGEVAETLQREQKSLLDALKKQITKTEEAETKEIAHRKNLYASHIRNADEKAEKLYQNAVALRKRNYQSWLEQAKSENDVRKLRDLAQHFASLSDYADSKALAEHCRNRADEEQANVDAERERLRIQQENQSASRKKKHKITTIIACLAVAAVIALIVIATQVIIPGNKYAAAEALLAEGKYAEAAITFEKLGKYKDSAVQADNAAEAANNLTFSHAEELIQSGDLQQAIELLRTLSDYHDADKKADYVEAELLLNQGESLAAAMKYYDLHDYSDAYQKFTEIWSSLVIRTPIAADSSHTIGILHDGTVISAGSDSFHRCDVDDWADILAVATSNSMTIGLKNDGTLVGCGKKDVGLEYIPEFSGIVAIAAADKHFVALRADGTVVAAGSNEYGQMDISSWQSVIAIDAALNFTIGLREDGTLLFAGDNEYGQMAVTKWTDIVKFDIGGPNVFGLKADGTVIATENTGEYRHWGQEQVTDWSDIVDIAAGSCHTVGLKSDGTVVAVGRNEDGECNVSKWRDIVAIYACDDCTIGLKSDGTVVATGKNDYSELDCIGWTNILIP